MRNHNKAFVRITLLALISCLSLVFGWRAFSPTATPAIVVFPEAMNAPDAAAVELALHRCGLTPESLAAAGASAADTTAVVNAMEAILTPDDDLIEAKEVALGDAAATRDVLERLVRAGLASEEDMTDWTNATQAEATARASRDAEISSARTTLLDELPQASQSLISTMVNNAGWGMPLEYKVIGRDNAEWMQLRHALANERIAANDPDEDIDPNAAAFLASVRSNNTVALAMLNLDNNLSAIEAAWDAALAQ